MDRLLDGRASEKVKYVWLHDSSSIRQARDKSKYDKARDLEKSIDRVGSSSQSR